MWQWQTINITPSGTWVLLEDVNSAYTHANVVQLETRRALIANMTTTNKAV